MRRKVSSALPLLQQEKIFPTRTSGAVVVVVDVVVVVVGSVGRGGGGVRPCHACVQFDNNVAKVMAQGSQARFLTRLSDEGLRSGWALS